MCPVYWISGWGSTMRRRGKVLLQVLLAFFAALITVGVTPAFAVEPPATSKILTPNNNGTYTLSLSVTGKSQASQEQSKADVIVVLDTSTSMSEGTGNSTRIQVARQAVNSLAQQLLANNKAENPDAVTLSLVTFDNYATTKITGTTAYATFSNAVPSSVQYNRGTNWEDALKTANAIQTRDGADVYIIFVSDGNPTFRDTHGGYSWQTNGEYARHTSGIGSNQKVYYGSGSSDSNGLNLHYAKSQASTIGGEGKTLFSVGVFGNVSNMQSIAQAAGQSNNYYSAADSDALNAAFKNIINIITHNLTYSGVTITDGLTSLTATSLVSGSASGFTYTKTENGVTSEWDDAPAASFDGSTVTWNLGSLEHGITYTVSFKVWPSQDAIDKVAQLQNSGTTTNLPAGIVYNTEAGTYGVQTNTSANVDFTQTSTTTTKVLPSDAQSQGDGTWTSASTGLTYTYDVTNEVYVGSQSESGTSALNQPDPMPVDTPTITVSKEWNDSLDTSVRPSGDITLNVLLDGTTTFTTVTLNAANNYQAQVHVPYGITAGGEDLTTGHNVTVSEDNIDKHYELSAETIRPMLVDGVLAMGGNGDATLSATNTLKSQIKISKGVTSDDGSYPAAASFDFSVTVTTPDGTSVPYKVYGSDNSEVSTGALASGTASTITLTAGQHILVDEVPAGTTYTATETSAPTGWSLSSLGSDGDADTVDGGTVSGTIAEGNVLRAVTYTNKFTPVESSPTGAGNLTVTKHLANRTLQDGQFTFTLTALDGAPAPSTATATNAADGSVTFSNIKFDKVGTYKYTLAEKNDGAAGYTYDTNTYTLVATVAANANTNALEVAWSIDGNDATAVTFNNTYEASGSAIINATKTLTGRDMAAGEFTFSLKSVEADAPMPVNAVTTNDANGNVAFGDINFTQANAGKTYHYYISEVAGDEGGVTYDTTVHAVTVEVVDNGDGTMSLNVDGNNPTFTNTYTAQPVTLEGDTALQVTKRVTGYDSSEPFSFNLALTSGDASAVTFADGASTATTSSSIKNGGTETASFGAVTFSKVGTYTFNVTENQGTKAGWEYDKSAHVMAVNVADNGKGQLVATVTDNNPTFENTYKAAESDGVVVIAKKVLTGSPLMAGEFSFQLIDEDGTVVREATNAADGSIAFDPITYTEPGTYTYTLKEVAGSNAGMTYDSNLHTVTVVATDDGTGQIHASVTSPTPTFTNRYESSVDHPVMLNAVKVLEGRRLEAGQFSFQLFDENGNPVGEPVTNDASGSIQFPALRYTQDDFDGITPDENGARTKTVTYTAREVAGNAGGYSYSENVATYTLELVDANDGKITATLKEAVNTTFTNNYEAQPVTAQSFSATKVFEGRSLAEGEFEFQLTAAEGTPMPETPTATNAANGSVTFSPITYHLSDLDGEVSKTFTYTISEVANGKAGVTYDEAKHTVSVTVTDNGNGTLSVSDPVYDGASTMAPTFTNTYEAAAVTTALPTVTKVVSGDEPGTYPTFGFTLEPLAGAPAPDGADENGVATVTINGAGSATIGSVTFDKAGTYSYKVYEIAGDAEGWTYDGSVYTVTYTVTDDGSGVLSATAAISTADGAADAVAFENVYTAPKPEEPVEPEEPTKPEDPAKPEEPVKPKPKKPAIPNTGDATQTALPVGLAVAAAAVLAAAVVVRRKGRRSK